MEWATKMTPTRLSLGGHGFSSRTFLISITLSLSLGRYCQYQKGFGQEVGIFALPVQEVDACLGQLALGRVLGIDDRLDMVAWELVSDGFSQVL